MLPFTESKSIGRFGRCEYEHICYGGGLPECFLSQDIGYKFARDLLLLEAGDSENASSAAARGQ
jgi:hypothetical protein